MPLIHAYSACLAYSRSLEYSLRAVSPIPRALRQQQESSRQRPSKAELGSTWLASAWMSGCARSRRMKCIGVVETGGSS